MIFTGKSADGSDARVVKGVYPSLCGTWWSSKPITREQKAYETVWQHCERYRKSMRTLYEQIKSGSKENLRKWVRDWFVEWYENSEEG
jgi:hypothetical protein